MKKNNLTENEKEVLRIIKKCDFYNETEQEYCLEIEHSDYNFTFSKNALAGVIASLIKKGLIENVENDCFYYITKVGNEIIENLGGDENGKNEYGRVSNKLTKT